MPEYQFNTGTYDAIKYRDELRSAVNPPMTAWDMVNKADWRRLYHRFLEDQVLLLGTEDFKQAVDFMAALAFMLDDNRAPGTVFKQTVSDEMASRFGIDLTERYFPATWSRETGEVYDEWTRTKQDDVLRQQLLNDATDRVNLFWDDFLEFWQATKDGQFDDLFPSDKERLSTLAADLPEGALDTFLEDESKPEEERALRRQARSLPDDALGLFEKRQQEQEQARQEQLDRDLREEIEDDDDDRIDFSLDKINKDELTKWNTSALKALDAGTSKSIWQVGGLIFIDGPDEGGQPSPSYVRWASQPDVGARQSSGRIEMTKKGTLFDPGTVTLIGPFLESEVTPALKAITKKKVLYRKQ